MEKINYTMLNGLKFKLQFYFYVLYKNVYGYFEILKCNNGFGCYKLFKVLIINNRWVKFFLKI